MKLRNIIAIATVMALLAVMVAPFTSTVSAADVIVLDGPPTTVEIGHYYSMNLLDYLPDTLYKSSGGTMSLATFVNLYNPVDAPLRPTTAEYAIVPSWIDTSDLTQYELKMEDGALWVHGTPLEYGSYTIQVQLKHWESDGYDPFIDLGRFSWTVDVVPETPDYTVPMLAGDVFDYQLTASQPSTYAVVRGDLSAVGLSLSGDRVSGTATHGRQIVNISATSTMEPHQVTWQVIEFVVYRVLGLGGTIQPTNVDGQSYSSQITVVDVDPDATGEVTLSLNQAAIDAGFKITRGSDTSWALTRTSAAFVSGEVPITITATTSAGGIEQTRTLSGSVNSYYDVKFTTTPSGHRGTGLTVWLIEGDGVWTYRPEAGPAGTTISVSGLVSGITWAGGVLTVSPAVPLDTTTVTITATSPDGYSSVTQVLTIKVWDKLVFTSRPSVENIITTVDGRNVTATAQASYYATILWDMGDGTTYEGNETITHEYAEYGQYTITATALHVLGYTAEQSVDVSIRPPSVMDGLVGLWPFVALIGALFVMIILFAMLRG